MIRCYQKCARWCDSGFSHKGPFIGLTIDCMSDGGRIGNSLCLKCAKELKIKLSKAIALAHLRTIKMAK